MTMEEFDFNFYALIDENFLSNENFEIEYKSGLNGFPKELWKTYSAFANTNTGFIIIGVKEHKLNSSMTKVDSFTPKVDSSTSKVDSSTLKVDSSNKNIPLQLKRDELENLIMDICKDRYMKLEEIAIQLGRSTDYLKNKIFPKMICDGKLEKKYPFTQTHPEQAYIKRK